MFAKYTRTSKRLWKGGKQKTSKVRETISATRKYENSNRCKQDNHIIWKCSNPSVQILDTKTGSWKRSNLETTYIQGWWAWVTGWQHLSNHQLLHTSHFHLVTPLMKAEVHRWNLSGMFQTNDLCVWKKGTKIKEGKAIVVSVYSCSQSRYHPSHLLIVCPCIKNIFLMNTAANSMCPRVC